ncbi:hypothetical protein BpHYR1_045621 [Brachionus plicatilis]|uniref:Uncharacterized protein n=1 Tax=Brachionus plicatilis TaxID=10195 RepID=A0A3M7PDF0_BRAPC|nr:hypothetical protein BpHYR1_045621 [Brachionus plicatilis]
MTVLTGLKFFCQLENSAKVSFVANNASNNGKNMKKMAKIIKKDHGTGVIVIAKTNTHIFVSKLKSFYSIALRTSHETYSKSSGYLFEGCRLQDQLDSRNKRETFNKINTECNADCSAIEFSAEDENFPQDLTLDLCLFDCNEIGKNSTSMIKSMVSNIKNYISNDSVDENIETTYCISLKNPILGCFLSFN